MVRTVENKCNNEALQEGQGFPISALLVIIHCFSLKIRIYFFNISQHQIYLIKFIVKNLINNTTFITKKFLNPGFSKTQ